MNPKDSVIDGVKVHPKKGCVAPCPFHAPSDHPLKDAPIHIRVDKACLVERICEHGVGHDDPDSVVYMRSHGASWAGVHGCDGCCTGTKLTDLQPSDSPSQDKGHSKAQSEDSVSSGLEEILATLQHRTNYYQEPHEYDWRPRDPLAGDPGLLCKCGFHVRQEWLDEATQYIKNRERMAVVRDKDRRIKENKRDGK